jgi:integrase
MGNPPVLSEYLSKFADWLHQDGYSVRSVRSQVRFARAFMVRQLDDCPIKLDEFQSIKGGSMYAHWRDHFAAENGKRVLPLDDDEKQRVQAASSKEGRSVPLRLRNAAIFSILLSPRPKAKHIRPDHIRGLTISKLAVENVSVINGVSKGTVIGYRAESIDVPLNDNAQKHVSYYLNDPQGYNALRSSYSNVLFPRGRKTKVLKGAPPVDPISRQHLYNLAGRIGERAEIIGVLGTDILGHSPLWAPMDSRHVDG